MRLTGLDVLRCIAILLVLGCHPPEGSIAPGSPTFLIAWYHVGWVGVDLFFVLSGFLIGGLLFAESKKTGVLDVRRFYVRRVFKIWPPYFVFLAAFAVLRMWDGRPFPLGLWPNLLHIQNYTGTANFPIWHTWSLAVEEHFYLLLPLLLLILTPQRYRLMPLVFAVVAAVCLLLRLLVPSDPSEVRFYSPTHLRMDSLLVGVLLAWAWLHSPGFVALVTRFRHVLPVAAVLCFLPVCFLNREESFFLRTFGFSLLWFGSSCLVLYARVSEGGAVLRSPPARWLAWVGSVSYGIYLWHMPFGQRASLFIGSRLGLSGVGLFCLFVVMAVFLGWLMTLAIERPALWFRSRFCESATRPPPVDVGNGLQFRNPPISTDLT